jgi:hypothetical protein
MFSTADDTLEAAIMLAERDRHLEQRRREERDRLRNRAQRHERERDRGRLRGEEPERRPLELRRPQRLPQLAQAPDLGQHHPQRQRERGEHHDVERLHPPELERRLRLATRARGHRAPEVLQDRLVVTEEHAVRRRQRGLRQEGKRGRGHRQPRDLGGNGDRALHTDESRGRDEQLRGILVEVHVRRRDRRDREVGQDHHTVPVDEEVRAVERAVRDARFSQPHERAPCVTEGAVGLGALGLEREEFGRARHEHHRRRPGNTDGDEVGHSDSCVTCAQEAECLVLHLLQPGERERGPGVLVGDEPPDLGDETRLRSITSVHAHRELLARRSRHEHARETAVLFGREHDVDRVDAELVQRAGDLSRSGTPRRRADDEMQCGGASPRDDDAAEHRIGRPDLEIQRTEREQREQERAGTTQWPAQEGRRREHDRADDGQMGGRETTGTRVGQRGAHGRREVVALDQEADHACREPGEEPRTGERDRQPDPP